MRTVRGFDYCDGLKSALRKPLHTSLLFIKSQMHLHHISCTCGCLEGKLVGETGPPDFQEFDILMNRCIFREATIQSKRHVINRIAAVKSKSFVESTELSGTDSLCPRGRASFQQLREKLTTVLTEAADNTGFR